MGFQGSTILKPMMVGSGDLWVSETFEDFQ